MGLEELAARLESASDAVAGTGTVLNRLDPGSRVFGGDATGQFGELGRQLHGCWVAAIAARDREAAAQAGRLAQAAVAVRKAVANYQETEQSRSDRSPVKET